MSSEYPTPRRKKSTKRKPAKKNGIDSQKSTIIGAVVGVVAVGIFAYTMGQQNAAPPTNNFTLNKDASTTSSPQSVPVSTPVSQPVPTNTTVVSIEPVKPSVPFSNNDAAVTNSNMSANESMAATENKPAINEMGESKSESGTTSSMSQAASGGRAEPSTSSTMASVDGNKSTPLSMENDIENTKELRLPDLIDLVEPAVIRIELGGSLGSGYVIHESGIAVTNYHVMEGGKRAQAIFNDGTKTPVEGYYYADDARDICIIKLKVPERGLKTLKIAKELPRKGIDVVGFGAPIGLSFTTSTGIISAIRPEIEMRDQFGANFRGTWLQTTTPISPGNSGGPLVDMRGNLVAMNTLTTRTGQNLNFAISCVEIRDAIANAKGMDLTPLDSKPLAEKNKGGSDVSRRLAVDIEDTPRAYKLLSQLDSVLMMFLDVTFDPTNRIKLNFIASAETTMKSSNVNIAISTRSLEDESGAILLMLLYLDEPQNANRLTAGTQEFHAQAYMLMVDPESKQKNKLVKVWGSEEVILGTISLEAAATGNLPRAFTDATRRFFGEFKAAITKSRREWTKLSKLTDEELASLQKEKETEILKKRQASPSTPSNKKKRGMDFDLPDPDLEKPSN
jgi:S1-C subfamily serine protease